MNPITIQSGSASSAGPDLTFTLDQPFTVGSAACIFVRALYAGPDHNLTVDVSALPVAGWNESASGSSGTVGLLRLSTVMINNHLTEQDTFTVSSVGADLPVAIEAIWIECTTSDRTVIPIGGILSTESFSPFSAAVGDLSFFVDPGTPLLGLASAGFETTPSAPGSLTVTSALVGTETPGGFPVQPLTILPFTAEVGGGSFVEAEWSGGMSGAMGQSIFATNVTKYSTVQQSSTPSLAMTTPTEGSLLLATGVFYGVSPSLDSSWNEFELVRGVGVSGFRLKVWWKRSDGNESLAVLNPMVSVAAAATFREVTGFVGVPSVSAGTPSSLIFTDDRYVTPSTPVPWPGGDCFWFNAFGVESLPSTPVWTIPDFSYLASPEQAFASGAGFSVITPNAPIGAQAFFEAEASGCALCLVFEDVPYVPPTPPVAPMICCPKSIKASAIRITRLNNSGIPLDPLTPNARIQTSAFAELSLSPDIENMNDTNIHGPAGGVIAIMDRGCDVLKGYNVELKLCGVPLTVLEMMTGINTLTTGGGIVGGAIRDSRDMECVNLVMIELWSKNVGSTCDTDGQWIQWVLPRSFKWQMSSSLSFDSGPLVISLSGYAEQNPAWYPSLPGPEFPSYVPGGGDPDGWPIGVAGPTLPDVVVPDSWTLADQATIRDSGPLAWKCVSALPFPLDDCGYLLSIPDCTPDGFVADFCGAEGTSLPSPWLPASTIFPVIPPAPLTLSGVCSVSTQTGVPSGAVVPSPECCGECHIMTVEGIKNFGEIGSPYEGQYSVPYAGVRFDDRVVAIGIQNDPSNYDAQIFAVVLNPDTFIPYAVGFSSALTLTEAQYLAPTFEVAVSWCSDGEINFRISFDGSIIFQGSVMGLMGITGWTDFDPDYAGFFGASPIANTVTGFETGCGSVAPGTPISLFAVASV